MNQPLIADTKAKAFNPKYNSWGLRLAQKELAPPSGWVNVANQTTEPVPGQIYQSNLGPVLYQPAQQANNGATQKAKKGGYDVAGQIKGNAVTNAVQLAIATSDMSLENILEQVRIVLQAHKAADLIYKDVMEGKQNAVGATQMTNSAVASATNQTPAQTQAPVNATDSYDDFDDDIPF